MTDMIRNVPLFSKLSDTELDVLTRHALVKAHSKGAIIVSEGDDTNFLYVILSGTVKVYASDESGKEIVLNTQGPGEYFGELALLDDTPRSASVMALEPCRLLVIAKNAFRQCLYDHPDMALVLLKELTGRIRCLTECAKRLALRNVYGRIVDTLYQLAHDDEGSLVIAGQLTHQDLACRIGASREMVSRILKDLVVGGYLEISNRRIVIKRKLPSSW